MFLPHKTVSQGGIINLFEGTVPFFDTFLNAARFLTPEMNLVDMTISDSHPFHFISGARMVLVAWGFRSAKGKLSILILIVGAFGSIDSFS